MADILFVVQSGSQFVEPFQITSLIGDSGKCRLLHSLVSVSSGNRAIACGQPVVNYDVYRYNCQDYSNVGGFLARNNKKDFVGALNRLTEERLYYDQTAAAPKKASSHWARLDGNSSKQMLELFENVISESKGKG